jgi:pseudouridine-5'-phosphate glycosidase
MPPILAIAEEVEAALAAGRPVVALESTIIAHGLPWPDNLEIGRALEAEVRGGGAVPATIAVVDGRPRVGLDDATLERLARDGARFRKAGAADLAVILAAGGDAATTVSGTVHLAALAGVRLMATGGIGGVHRGAAWDVSQDLATLASAPVAVVSAGAKAILDLDRTAEMLETLGVLLLGYRTSELPAFYTPWSGVPLEHRVETPAEAAAVLAERWRLGQRGVLVGNPIPAAAALDAALVEEIITASLGRAAAAGIRGKALTPYLLADLERQSGGATVRANRALALANARLAAEIAVAFGRLA